MFIDFEKAFDLVSWKFMYKVVRYYNFSEEFLKWITLFNNKIIASILQVGILLEFSQLKEDVNKGTP